MHQLKQVSAKELAAKKEIIHAVNINMDHQCKLNEALVRQNKDLLESIKSLEESNSVMSRNIELQDDYWTQIESDRVALLGKAEVYEERASSFTEKVAILEKTIEENLEMARSNDVRNGEEIKRGRVQLSTLERKLARAEDKNASLERDNSSLKESLSSRDTELEEATSEVSKLEVMVKSLSRDIDSKDLEIAALRSSRRDADDKKIKATEQPTLPVNMSPTASTMEARQQVASNGPSTSTHTVGAQQQPRTFAIPTHHSERSHSYRTPSSHQARAKASDGGDYVVLGQNGEAAVYPRRTPYHGGRSSGGYNGHPWNGGHSFYQH
ncbi:hypothetical protein FRC02_007378 [Tulasnella sp. 418]|nr:hypothetical protein FRC02_007378 [Tulasnella sp. 418]